MAAVDSAHRIRLHNGSNEDLTVFGGLFVGWSQTSHKLFGRESGDIFDDSNATSGDMAMWITSVDSTRQIGRRSHSDDVLPVVGGLWMGLW